MLDVGLGVMDFSSWIQIVIICVLGAMSPGPSLAAVVSNTLARGRMYGIATGLGHGVGILLWASLTAVGVAQMIVEASFLLLSAQLIGACLLAYIGYRTIGSGLDLIARSTTSSLNNSQVFFRGTGEGFMISILNPKIALFFLAIFSQFVHQDSDWFEAGLMGITAGVIDAIWYIAVALAVSRVIMPQMLQTKTLMISKISGSLLIVISAYLAYVVIQGLLGW